MSVAKFILNTDTADLLKLLHSTKPSYNPFREGYQMVSCNNCKRQLWCPAFAKNTLHYCNKHTTKYEPIKIFPSISTIEELVNDHE